jgi:membrane protein DedA with SNARE-associated domain
MAVSAFIALAPTIAITVTALLLKDQLAGASEVGYLGVFFGNLIASGSLMLPVPGLAAAFAPAAMWNPILIALAGASGSTIGETTGYLAGVSARGATDKFAAKHKWYGKIEGLVQKRGMITIAALAIIPAPGFYVVGIVAGSLRYPFHRFIIAVLVGRLIKFGVAATIGYYGAPIIMGLFS